MKQPLKREWWGGKIRSVAVNSGSIINIDLTIVGMKPTIRERVVGRECLTSSC
jgi:hypothetical protein